MNEGYFSGPLVLIINTVCMFYAGAVLFRLLLQWVRADFYNPLSQAVVKITNPALRPLRRLIPAAGRLDTASVVLALGVQALAVVLKVLVNGGTPGALGVLVLAAGDCLELVVDIFRYSLIALFIASWVAPHQRNAALALLDELTEPLVMPVRRRLPPLGGLDFSLAAVLLGLSLFDMLVVRLVQGFGASLL